jgi:hypothetical protein
MNCFTPYCYCANFGNLQKGEMSRDFVAETVKTTNNPANILTAREYIKELRIIYTNIAIYGQTRKELTTNKIYSTIIYVQMRKKPATNRIYISRCVLFTILYGIGSIIAEIIFNLIFSVLLNFINFKYFSYGFIF